MRIHLAKDREDKIWGIRALEARKKGYIGVEQSIELLKKIEQKIKNNDNKVYKKLKR